VQISGARANTAIDATFQNRVAALSRPKSAHKRLELRKAPADPLSRHGGAAQGRDILKTNWVATISSPELASSAPVSCGRWA